MPDRPGTSHSCHPASGEGRNELERAGVQAEFGDSSPADASGRTDALAEHSAVGGFEVDETAELAKAIPDLHEEVPALATGDALGQLEGARVAGDVDVAGGP